MSTSTRLSKYTDLLDNGIALIESDDDHDDDAGNSETNNNNDVSESDCSLLTSSDSSNNSRVRFALSVEVAEIMSLDGFSEEEIKECWYSQEEKERIHARKDKLVERIEAGRPPKKGRTYRGLECWTMEGSAQIEGSIARVIDAVIDEQDVQWARNVDDHDRLAVVSLAVTGDSKQRAREMAVRDECEAAAAWEGQEEVQRLSQEDKGTPTSSSQKRDGEEKSKTSRSNPSKNTTSPRTRKCVIKVQRSSSNDAILKALQLTIRTD